MEVFPSILNENNDFRGYMRSSMMQIMRSSLEDKLVRIIARCGITNDIACSITMLYLDVAL